MNDPLPAFFPFVLLKHLFTFYKKNYMKKTIPIILDFFIKVDTEIRSPGIVIPIGATSISFSDHSPFRYTFGGSYKSSLNNVFINGGCSYHGTVVGSGITSSGTDFIDVKWTVATSSGSSWGGGSSAASVSGTSKNICSNNTASGWLTPITIQ
jgi:hypothetical protein